jgi:hypothetical protein
MYFDTFQDETHLINDKKVCKNEDYVTEIGVHICNRASYEYVMNQETYHEDIQHLQTLLRKTTASVI